MSTTETTEAKEKSKVNNGTDEAARRQRELEEREAEARRREELQRELREKEAIKNEQERTDSRLREQKTDLQPIGVDNPDGSSFIKDELGRVSETKDANGTIREFGYNDKGELNSFSENGKVWSTKDGSNWESPGEKSRTMRAVVNAEDGTFAVAEAGVTRVEFLNGNTLIKDANGSILQDKQQRIIDTKEKEPTSETRTVTTTSKEQLIDTQTITTTQNQDIQNKQVDREQMEVAADAFYANTAGRFGTGEDEINALLKDKTEAEKKVMDEIYRRKYHTGLKEVLEDELSGSDLERSMTLLQKKDGSADDAGRLQTNLVELSEYTGRSNFNVERDIRQTVSTMNSQQINELDKEYQQRFNKPLRQALMDDPNLSKESKEMLEIYFKGTDKRTNEDSLKLFDIALKSGDVERFNESAAAATSDARKQFMNNVGDKRLSETFGSGSTEYNHALDYAKFGRLSTASKVSANTSWMGDNEEAIERSIKEMTLEERANYVDGKLLSEGKPVDGLNVEQQTQAKSTYETLRKSLEGAGDAWEVAKWEEQIAVKGGGLATALAQHRGSIYDDSTHLVLKDIESMSEQDWKAYKTDEAYRQRVDTVLKDYLSDDEYARAKKLLDEKAAAETYEQAKGSGNRDLLTVIKDNEGNFDNDEGEIWNAIENMSVAQQEKYRNDDKFRASVDEAVARTLDTGTEEDVANGMLTRVLAGGSPKADIIDKLNKHSADTNTDEAAVIRDVEQAFVEDSSLRLRLNNPQTEADKDLASRFDKALRSALDPTEYERYAKTLLSKGRIEQSLKQELNTGYFDDDEQGTYTDMASLGKSQDAKSNEEKNKILSDKAYQDQVMGHLSDDERAVALNALKQGEMRPEDKIRSQMLGAGTGENEIKEVLRKLTPEQKAQVKLDYAKKYGSEMVVDLLDELGGQDSRDVSRLIANEPQSDREAFNNVRDEANESRDGIGRWWVDTTWDGTGYMTDESVLNMQRRLSEASAQYENLSPEERKELENTVRENIDAFVQSKGAAADMLVDAVIIAGAIAGAKFTGGASLSLITYTTLAGAAFKVASKSAIMGADYDWTSTQVLTDALTGAIDTGTMFLGPAQLAIALKLGEKSATTATRKILLEGGEQVMKSEMRQTFGKELTKLVSTSIAHGEQGVGDKPILELAKKFAVEGQEEALAASVKTSLKESIDVESRNALKSLATETSLNSTAGAFGGGMSGGTRGVFEWDSNKSVADNLKMVAAQTAMGAITGTTMAGGMTLGFKAIAAPASKGIQYLKTTSSTNIPEVRTTATVTADGNNALISADANPHIQGVKRKDGSIVELKQGEKITLEDGDTPITRTDDAGFPIDADGTPITDESAVDLNNNSDVFGYSQPPSESPQYKKGDLVSFGDDEYQVAGFDRNNGDVIIYQKGRGEETISPDVKEGELGTKYRIIRINGQNYFRDAAGNVYNKIDQGRAFALVPDNQYKVVPRDEIKFNAKPVKAPQSVKFSPDGFQDNKWHPAIYEVDDVQVELMPMSGWHWSGKRPGVNSNELGSVKIDVTAMNLDDAQKIQQYLLPLLDNDPAFAPPKMLSWKTLNPARGMAGGTEPLSAQDAKVFTLYCSNPADAIAIQKKLDQMIKEAGLGLDKPPQSGNVFRISGESNRVGIVRDTFTQSVDSQQWDPAINLDESLARSLENEFGNGQLLSKEQLERLINTVGMKKQEPPIIFYDSQGKLSMRVSAGRDGGHHDYSPYGVYVTEAGAGKVVGELTDRPALYSLYDRYRIDPVDEAVRLQRVNEVVTSKPSVPRASANGQKYETNKVSIIGRSSGSEIQIATTDGSVGVSSRHAAIYTDSAGNTYIADLGSTNGTYINDQKIASSSDTSKPNWVRINPGDKVTLGPTFDLNLGNPGPTGQ